MGFADIQIPDQVGSGPMFGWGPTGQLGLGVIGC